QMMDSGIDNQPARPPDFHREPTEVAVRVFVKAGFQTESLGVEAPAFDERGESGVLAKLRQFVQLLLQRNLKMMPGYCLVQCESFEHVERSAGKVVRVDIEEAGPAAIARRPLIIGE